LKRTYKRLPLLNTRRTTLALQKSTPAIRRAEEVSQEKMGKLTAGMPLPPGMKLPF